MEIKQERTGPNGAKKFKQIAVDGKAGLLGCH